MFLDKLPDRFENRSAMRKRRRRVLVGSIKLLGSYGETAWRYPLALSPVLPASAALLAFVRFFRAMDELEQRMHLEGLAFAFGASALATFAYGFLEGAGFPHLNWTFVWPVWPCSGEWEMFWQGGVIDEDPIARATGRARMVSGRSG